MKYDEEIGKKYGSLKVLQVSVKDSKAVATAICECGSTKQYRLSALKTHNTKTCGCTRYGKQTINNSDYINARFGNLVIIDRVINGKNCVAKFKVKCDCGKEKNVVLYSLLNGDTKSCGCLRKESTRIRQTRHGEAKTKLYNVWILMRRRCNDENQKCFHNYGGRGIKVCNDWNEHFEKFSDWAADKYATGLQIDRIDNNGNYEPNNCRFVTPKQNANNKRSNILIEFNRKKLTISEWSTETGISPSLLWHRLNKGWTIEHALTIKPNSFAGLPYSEITKNMNISNNPQSHNMMIA